MAERPTLSGLTVALAAVIAAPAALFLLAAAGLEFGWWPVTIAYDLLGLQVVWWLSVVGLVAGIGLAVMALRRRAPWWLGVAGMAAAAATFSLAGLHQMAVGRGEIENVSTDLAEVPGFGGLVASRGPNGPGDAVGPESCPGAVSLPSQAAPQSAAWALHQAGFEDISAGVGRATGTKRGAWFGFDMDAIIRIRPGRSDIRVAARDHRSHGGQACRLATKISETLRNP